MRNKTLTRVIALSFAIALALPQPGFARTVTGTARPNRAKIFTFIADEDGQVLSTLTWTKASADLFFIILDVDDEPLSWCIAAADQDRTQRCEFGAFEGVQYAIGVQSFRGSSKFQLNVQTSGSEFVSGPAGEHPRPRGVAGLVELGPEDPGYAQIARLMQRAIHRLKR